MLVLLCGGGYCRFHACSATEFHEFLKEWSKLMSETVGFIGLGAMGGPMSRRLVDAGHKVFAFDPNQKALDALVAAGATAVASTKALADTVETILVSLPTPDVVKSVAQKVAEGSKAKLLIDLSTTGPRAAVEIGGLLNAKGLEMLDSPVSGGVGGAEKGTLAVMVSGPEAQWERWRPVLEVIGKSAFFVGEGQGQGQMMKLINNMLSATAMIASTEAFVLGAKFGLDPDVMVDVINAGSGANTAVRDKFPKAVLTRTFDYGFRTELMYKDVKLCLEEAEALGSPMWVGQPVKQWWALALARGGPQEDFSNIMRYVEEQAGVEVRSRKNDPKA
jgi:3-hydroxyisobutyrate dehydrogenase-like beta-hydroxyacid dehydrogenase